MLNHRVSLSHSTLMYMLFACGTSTVIGIPAMIWLYMGDHDISRYFINYMMMSWIMISVGVAIMTPAMSVGIAEDMLFLIRKRVNPQFAFKEYPLTTNLALGMGIAGIGLAFVGGWMLLDAVLFTGWMPFPDWYMLCFMCSPSMTGLIALIGIAVERFTSNTMAHESALLTMYRQNNSEYAAGGYRSSPVGDADIDSLLAPTHKEA